MWKFYSCPWALKQMPIIRWATFQNMVNGLEIYMKHKDAYQNSVYKSLHYCPDVDTYFVLSCYKIDSERDDDGNWQKWHYLRLIPVNEFAPYLYDKREDADMTEIGIVPVCIDHTDELHGDMMFLECGTYGNEGDEDPNQTPSANALEEGEKEKKEEYFDKLYVGFWNGNAVGWHPFMPHPIIHKVEIRPNNVARQYDYSMRLTSSNGSSQSGLVNRIDQSRKYTFQFLADSILDVRSIFLIHGKKYLAEKITATFSAETGMSQLLKMDAYRIVE